MLEIEDQRKYLKSKFEESKKTAKPCQRFENGV